jgi:hypothetical protein
MATAFGDYQLWPQTAVVTFGALLLAWLFVYAIVGIGRWIRAGFVA